MDRWTPRSLEIGLHQGLERWACQHAERYPNISLLPYDPARFPDQAIDVVLSRTRQPTSSEFEALHEFYLRSSAGAAATLAAFTAPHSTSPSLGSAIRDLVEDGQRVAVLSAHAERLDDVGELLGAVAVASGRADFFPLNSVILNKVMTRETFEGTPVVDLLRPFANIYWVVPDSESSRRWEIPGEAARYVNLQMLRALLTALRNGAAVTFAPAGSAMITHHDSSGTPVALEFPEVSSATRKLLSRFDAYVLAVRWREQIVVEGPYTPDDGHSSDAAAQIAMQRLATLVTRASGLPVLPLKEPDSHADRSALMNR